MLTAVGPVLSTIRLARIAEVVVLPATLVLPAGAYCFCTDATPEPLSVAVPESVIDPRSGEPGLTIVRPLGGSASEVA